MLASLIIYNYLCMESNGCIFVYVEHCQSTLNLIYPLDGQLPQSKLMAANRMTAGLIMNS